MGRSSSFEVVVNGNLIFSKLECQGFPYSKDVIAEIKKIQAGEKVSPIDDAFRKAMMPFRGGDAFRLFSL